VHSRSPRTRHLASSLAIVSLTLACAGSTGGARAQAQTGASGTADAQLTTDDEVARGLFQAGRAAYAAGRFDEALGFFEQAYARSERPELLFNIGQAADRLRLDAKALRAFEAFLEERPDAPNRAEVEARIVALRHAEGARRGATGEDPDYAPAQTFAPSPEQTATQAEGARPYDDAHTRSDDDTAVTERWWFWTGLGAVVIGGTALALALALGGDGAADEAPYEGNGGSLRGP
jgi:tetratricopeptide (TPR) repeat protein